MKRQIQAAKEAQRQAIKEAKLEAKKAKEAEKKKRNEPCPEHLFPYPDFWRTALSHKAIHKCYQFTSKTYPGEHVADVFTEKQHEDYSFYKKVRMFNVFF